jgi:hypothetical protein
VLVLSGLALLGLANYACIRWNVSQNNIGLEGGEVARTSTVDVENLVDMEQVLALITR